jgi:catechol 2,3-dioxygenase-like lactoylglutathione lyase family enzyme
MKLNHLNLTVTNVNEAIHFFETYFDFTCVATKGDNMVAVLNGVDGFELVLMNASMNKKDNNSYPDAFHIGFMLKTEEQVIAAYNRLKEGGITLERAPQKIRDNFGFYFHFDTLMIEIGAQLKNQNDDLTLDSSLHIN